MESGYTVQSFQTIIKNGVAYLYFTVFKRINSTTPVGVTMLISNGVPKPLLNSGETMLIAPCNVYTEGHHEFPSSLQIGTSEAINFIITQEMVDEASESSGDIELTVICELSYIVDPN